MMFCSLPRERKVMSAPFHRAAAEVQFGIRPATWRESRAALFRLELPKTLTEKIFSVPTERNPAAKFLLSKKKCLC